VAGRGAGVVPGDRADLVQFRFAAGRIEVMAVWLSGRKVF
jgi:hypothetical protein